MFFFTEFWSDQILVCDRGFFYFNLFYLSLGVRHSYIFYPKQKRKHNLVLDVLSGSGETEKRQSARNNKAARRDSVKLFTITTSLSALCSFPIPGQHQPVGFPLVPRVQQISVKCLGRQRVVMRISPVVMLWISPMVAL